MHFRLKHGVDRNRCHIVQPIADGQHRNADQHFHHSDFVVANSEESLLGPLANKTVFGNQYAELLKAATKFEMNPPLACMAFSVSFDPRGRIR
jgi:hypothetical protein